jgi:hypothetical protein
MIRKQPVSEPPATQGQLTIMAIANIVNIRATSERRRTVNFVNFDLQMSELKVTPEPRNGA